MRPPQQEAGALSKLMGLIEHCPSMGAYIVIQLGKLIYLHH